MVDNYLNTFENLFFNPEKNINVKEILLQVSSVISSIITKYCETEIIIASKPMQQDNFVDAIICLFIRKIIEQLDAINALFSIASFTQVQILLRSLIENIISLEFILKEDTPKRAAAYFLEHHYQEIYLGKFYFERNHKTTHSSYNDPDFSNNYEKYQKKKRALKHLINSKSIFKEIDICRKQKIRQKKKKKKTVYIQWYETCSNVSNFYELMKATGYEKYYTGIYGSLSYETHSLNSTIDLTVTNNNFALKKIRNPTDGSTTFSLVCIFAISALNKLYLYVDDCDKERL